ncbi:MAG: hypothetical protein JO110_01285, partial [Acetobacteraceae bacterium]|nr:hypothetical protein [Acetobacteraceae bacterium]
GPLDILARATEKVGAVDEDLRAACLSALGANPAACRRYAEEWSWDECAAQLRNSLAWLATEEETRVRVEAL